MNLTQVDQTTIRRALELAIRQVPFEDGVEFRMLLEKINTSQPSANALDGFRYDYNDNI